MGTTIRGMAGYPGAPGSIQTLTGGEYLHGDQNQSGTWTDVAVLLSNIRYLANTKVIANQTTSQSIPNAAFAVVTGWVTALDALGEFNASTGVLTVTNAGQYWISAGCQMAPGAWAAGGTLQVAILSGSTQMFKSGVCTPTAYTTGSMLAAASGMVNCAAGATISAAIYQSSGAALSTVSGQSQSNYFMATRL